LEIEEVFADKAYFRKSILDKVKDIKAEAYIPVSESVYRIDEEKFSYNKDSYEWFCQQGNKTISKKYTKYKNGREFYRYKFEREKCRNCPKRKECITSKSIISKVLIIGINVPEFYDYSQKQKNRRI